MVGMALELGIMVSGCRGQSQRACSGPVRVNGPCTSRNAILPTPLVARTHTPEWMDPLDPALLTCKAHTSVYRYFSTAHVCEEITLSPEISVYHSMRLPQIKRPNPATNLHGSSR